MKARQNGLPSIHINNNFLKRKIFRYLIAIIRFSCSVRYWLFSKPFSCYTLLIGTKLTLNPFIHLHATKNRTQWQNEFNFERKQNGIARTSYFIQS